MIGRIRLGHKLALSFSVAALLPVIIAASVAVRVVLRGLEDGVREQTSRQLRVGMNLVLRNVERLGGDVQKLASEPALADAVGQGDSEVAEFLAHEDPHLPSAFVQVTDAKGHILAARAIGGDDARYLGLRLAANSPLIRQGLEYERRVTITPTGGMLVIHAVAPIVDPSYGLKGVVIMSLPLDGDFADGIKGALGTDVLIHSGAEPAMSSFLDDNGGRVPGIAPPPGIAIDVLAGGSRQTRADIAGYEYTLGYAPLKNIDGEHVGMFGVAVGRGALSRAKTAAARSLALGAAGAFAFALVLAGLLSRRLTRPIGRLHAGALAIARGELDPRHTQIEVARDEIGDLANAFSTMTTSLRENQERLAARMREIVALHEAGRAVSSVLGLDEVLRKIVDSIARVLDTRLAALWLVEAPPVGEESAGRPVLRIGATRARIAGRLEGADAAEVAGPLDGFAAEVAEARLPTRTDALDDTTPLGQAALAAQVDGSLLAVPLERGKLVVGVLIVGRGRGSAAFSDADENLLATFADQGATAIENARLYEEVRAFSEELEAKVMLRTRELTSINAELGRALLELRETQSQLVHSERMAGLGALVAGVAHEINSPSAAIRGSVDALAENVRRLARSARELGQLEMEPDERKQVLAVVEELAPRLAEKRVGPPADARRRAKALAARLEAEGVDGHEVAARALVEIGADEAIDLLAPLLHGHAPEVMVAYLREYTYLHRNAAAIQGAIKQIQRIVGALKGYSHLDQAKVEAADVHEGIENTLTILHHELKYGISIVRRYGQLPAIPIYVDELNQVWTNLIHNAVQALGGKGEITIETASEGGAVVVKIVDSGPGISADVMPRIFEPFFTTKGKGEGTGLGLGIVKRILDKHGGSVEVDSVPGRTCFTVQLPVSGPPTKVQESPGAAHVASA